MKKNEVIQALVEANVQFDENDSVPNLLKLLKETTQPKDDNLFTATSNENDEAKDNNNDNNDSNDSNVDIQNQEMKETKNDDDVEFSSQGLFLVEGRYTSKFLKGRGYPDIMQAMIENAKAIREAENE
mgnify:CR=1 FL=1